MSHSKYPSIGQYRNIIKEIKDSSSYVGQDEEGNPIFDITKKAPTLTFTGTTKIHGSISPTWGFPRKRPTWILHYVLK